MRWLIAVGVLVGCKSVDSSGESDAALSDALVIDAGAMNPDFVINTTHAGSQFLSNDFEAGGLQLAAISDNAWIATFREDCVDCDLFARRFDANGVPLPNGLTGNLDQFRINVSKTTSAAVTAVAAGSASSSPEGTERVAIVIWDHTEPGTAMQSVACRGFDLQGFPTSSQVLLATDPADVVTANAIGNGNFVVTWQSFMTTQVVRSMIVARDCTTLSATPVTVSTEPGSFGARRSHAAANGGVVMYTWIVDGNVHIRTGDVTGALVTFDTQLIAKTTSHEIDHVRIAAWGSEFAVATRSAAITGMGPGMIEVYRVSRAGQILDGPHLITDRSGSDFASDKAFGIATNNGGYVLVAWHSCATGPGSCDVFGRFVAPSGEVLGAMEQVLPTTSASDQINPSVIAVGDVFVAAWTDSSGASPDSSGSAVRARIIVPSF